MTAVRWRLRFTVRADQHHLVAPSSSPPLPSVCACGEESGVREENVGKGGEQSSAPKQRARGKNKNINTPEHPEELVRKQGGSAKRRPLISHAFYPHSYPRGKKEAKDRAGVYLVLILSETFVSFSRPLLSPLLSLCPFSSFSRTS